MTALRRSLALAVTMALLIAPGTALALDDTSDTATTDRATTDRAITDRPDLDEAKKRALMTIERQLDALEALRSKIGAARYLTDDHAAQLLRDVATAYDGLTELARKIEAATTAGELAELIRQIDDWKIAQLLAPKTTLVIGSDASVAAGRALDEYGEKLSSIIARFEEAGFDVDEAWRLLDDMKANTAEGVRLGGPVAESVIGLEPADWPDPAQVLLSAGRTDLADSKAAFAAAKRDAKQIVAFLRALHDRATDL